MGEDVFTCYIDPSECSDSMLFDRDTLVATYGTDEDYIALEVNGDVRVVYDDAMYRYASEMPPELRAKFESGNWWDDDEIRVDSNNWFSYVRYVDHIADGDDIVCEDLPADRDGLRGQMSEVLEWFRNPNAI